MGKLEHFEVVFDHPNAVFNAGEILKGAVQVTLREPMKMRKLFIVLNGRGKVHWTKTTRSGKHSRTTHYRAEELYFDTTVLLFGSNNDDSHMHPEGTHSYRFELPLNPNLPSSFEGLYGYVRYSCKATIDKPWKFDHDTKSAFTVLSRLDLNYEPPIYASPIQGNSDTEISCCCCVSGNVRASFQINKRAFVPGETIYITAEVVNNSNSTVNYSKVGLKQYTEFSGCSDSLFSSGSMTTKCVSDMVAEKTHGKIEPGNSDNWTNEEFQIPALPPSRLVGCNIINISYVIKFYVSVDYGSDIKIASDIVIGTIPLYTQYPRNEPVINQQPMPVQANPSAPPMEGYTMPPPAYEACVKGPVAIKEDNDSEYTRGSSHYTPYYPVYHIQNAGPNYLAAANQI